MKPPSHPAPAPVVACFGELLWDCLPRGIFPGGAPANVAYHLARQGLRARPVSAVGRDFLGDELLRRLAAAGVDPRFIARLADRPTGTVRAALDRNGSPTFTIHRAVAWDRIPVPRRRRSHPPAAVVFGTLALREPANRRALAALLAAWPSALRVADLNLRPPFDSPKVIDLVLGQAQLLKLNDSELRRVAGKFPATPAGRERAVTRLGRRHGLSRVCVTAGAHGAGLWWDGSWHWEKARPVDIRDTIGAGDAFLAGLLAALLRRRQPPRAALAHACRMGEFVASRDGSMPPYRCDSRGRPVEM
ncbi:MAG TPA: PfkB family carbohydrate kinase [Opitutaceae bacterium]|nr:PfkB family carbohydrate kinase [Opitutaceae bacterium]